jgi:hypothetical protein
MKLGGCIMKFHDDMYKAFAPLESFVKEQDVPFEDTIGQYMYMFHDDEDIYHYKNSYDRTYVKLDEKGNHVSGQLRYDWL